VSVAVFAWRSRFHFVFQGVVKQRMVKHGRDVAANWAKLESGKAACMQGCDFAAHGENTLLAKDKDGLFRFRGALPDLVSTGSGGTGEEACKLVCCHEVELSCIMQWCVCIGPHAARIVLGWMRQIL
jgi:hypothetical protein